MRYLSVCSGIEAASVAWHPLGWEPVGFSEIEKFPSALLAHRYPQVKNYGDLTKFAEWDVGKFDLLVGGTPCFAGRTLIATRRGLIPIADVVVGDEVITHKNRWRRVLAHGQKFSEKTMTIHGQGQSSGIVTTNDHPFYARKKIRRWVGLEFGSYVSELSAPEWRSADSMIGHMWSSPAKWPTSEAPLIASKGREASGPDMTDKLAWIVGRWIGDGWTRINERRGYAIICCGDHEADDLGNRIKEAGLHASRLKERTTTRFQIGSRSFARWLKAHFGSGAASKTIPTWVFGWKYRNNLLDGYISADGCKTPNGTRITTVSDALALGVVLLAHSLGKSASRRLAVTGRNSPTIEGRRLVSEKPFWQISIYDKSRSSIEHEGHRWGLVRKTIPNGPGQTVFNIEVEEDNSYVADGICVHNCQSFSIAGLRSGLSDPRGSLMLSYLALADKHRPEWLVWENVPGVLSSNGGRDFGTFLGGLGKLGYGFAYRVLDAQYFGSACPRPRVFVVANSGGWRRAAKILFERKSFERDIKKKASAGPVFTKTGGMAQDDRTPCILEWDGARIATPLEWERAMGFPDSWTKIKFRGREVKAGPRYEAIGNSFSVHVAKWIGSRIDRLK